MANRPAFTHAGHGEGGEFHIGNFLDKIQNYFGKLYAVKNICQAIAQKVLISILILGSTVMNRRAYFGLAVCLDV